MVFAAPGTWLVAAALLLILPWSVFVPLSFGFIYHNRDGKHHAWIILGAVRVVRVAIPIPVARIIRRARRRMRRRGMEAVTRIGKIRPLVQMELSATRFFLTLSHRIERFEWSTAFGTGDAAATSWLVGTLWGAKAGIVTMLGRHFDFETSPRLDVVPDFDNTCFRIRVRCIFAFTIGEIIVAALSSVPFLQKGR